jgi:excisionase family DNA binding protein
MKHYTKDVEVLSGRLLLRGGEVANVLGISRALAYRWMQNGTLPTIRVSKSVRVPSEGLRAWIERTTQYGPTGKVGA